MNEPTVKIARYTDQSFFDVLITFDGTVAEFLRPSAQHIEMGDGFVFDILQRFSNNRDAESVYDEMVSLIREHVRLVPPSPIRKHVLDIIYELVDSGSGTWTGRFEDSEGWHLQ